MQDRRRNPSRLPKELVAGGLSVGFATAFTNPIDVVKVRLQVDRARGGSGKGLVGTAAWLVRSEGPLALTGGLGAAVTRGVTYGGIRLGLYGPVRPLFGADEENAGLANKAAASVFTGALAASLTNPMDLVKTKGQVYQGTTGEAKSPGAIAVLARVYREEGWRGLWRGTAPGATRAAILTCSQLVTYSEAKTLVKHRAGLQEGFWCHLVTSALTGLVATTTTNPVDVVKTRVYAARREGGGGTGVLGHCAAILRNEGASGFLKGWSASYLRLGPQTAITFLVYEQARKVVGLECL